MKRRDFLRTVCLGTIATAALGKPIRLADRPNIVLILADDVGRDALACYGGA